MESLLDSTRRLRPNSVELAPPRRLESARVTRVLMKKLLLCLFANLSLATLAATSVAAAEPAAAPAKAADAAIRAAIAKKFPEMKIDEVRATPMKDIYEVQMGGEIAYISGDGKFLIAGDMFEIDTRTNLTENGRQKGRIQ